MIRGCYNRWYNNLCYNILLTLLTLIAHKQSRYIRGYWLFLKNIGQRELMIIIAEECCPNTLIGI